LLGGFLTGLFATVPGVAAFGDTNPGGAIEGNGKQVWLQIVGALFIIGWDAIWTSLIMLFIKYVCRVPLRMSEEDMMMGDDAVHGEGAYCFFDDVVGPTPETDSAVLEGLKVDNDREIGIVRPKSLERHQNKGDDLEKGCKQI
jgi:Amt family ammonium transporter